MVNKMNSRRIIVDKMARNSGENTSTQNYRNVRNAVFNKYKNASVYRPEFLIRTILSRLQGLRVKQNINKKKSRFFGMGKYLASSYISNKY